MPVLLAGLTGELRIELSQPPEPITPALANVAAKPDARVLSVRLEVEAWEEDSDEPRPLAEEEWNAVVLEEPRLVLRSESDEDVVHEAPNGVSFTTREVIAAIEETERRTRGDSEWFGGVDVHHVFFEGLELEEEDPPVWRICWGS